MEIDPNFSSLLRTLRVDDPWVPPKTWESIPSESGSVRSADSCGQSQDPIYESSLISVSQFLGNYNSLLAILPFVFFGIFEVLSKIAISICTARYGRYHTSTEKMSVHWYGLVIPLNNAQSLYSGRSSNIPIILLSGADYVFSATLCCYSSSCKLNIYSLSSAFHIAWSRFEISQNRLANLDKIKVKDMLDLESVHMSYLAEALHICFLSEDTKPVAVIIENILQCALDFGLHLTGGRLYAGTNRPDPLNLQSDINLCKVLAYFSH
ncbi:hypothetical protein GW17_00024692 [Ensete ventricosum]|nr:hypothetical protein GW17_00024692 [Ensete ventricosum]